MIGIKDIAAAAGVSLATISNALNGRKNVSEETRAHILKICEEMHYEPNLTGRALKSGTTKTIMFNFSDFDRKFYLEIIHGIHDYVCTRDYDLIICTSKSCEKFMNKSLSCGGIIQDIHCPDSVLIKKAEEGYPIIAMDRVLDEPNIKSVVVNNYDPEYELVEKLVQKGCTEFAFLNGPDTDDSKERYRAFLDVLKKHAIPFGRESYYAGDFREKSGYQAARLLLLTKQLPDVLVCANDNMAIGAMKAFRDNGIKVPDDIMVCGFDNSEMASVYNLTTVAIPNYERGYLAAQYLIENVNGAGNFDPFYVSAKVKWRESTDRKA